MSDPARKKAFGNRDDDLIADGNSDELERIARRLRGLAGFCILATTELPASGGELPTSAFDALCLLAEELLALAESLETLAQYAMKNAGD